MKTQFFFPRILFLWLAVAWFGGDISARAQEAVPPKPRVDQLAWLAGAWGSIVAGAETEEHWLAPKGGLMLGLNRVVSERRGASFEYLRIANTTNGVSYFASPQGRPATEFPLKETDGRKVVFENLKHDYPHRIIYRLEGDRVLVARIEGVLNGEPRSREWRWEKR